MFVALSQYIVFDSHAMCQPTLYVVNVRDTWFICLCWSLISVHIQIMNVTSPTVTACEKFVQNCLQLHGMYFFH